MVSQVSRDAPSSRDALRRATAMTLEPRSRPPAASPWRRISVIYAILALAVFAFPGGIVDWLDEHNSTGWLDAPLAIARGVDAVSAAAGVKAVGQGLRKQFSSVVGAGED